MRRPEDCESSHLGDGRCKERETQQTERREYEQRAERCGILRSLTTFVAYMTTHAHKRPMRMRNMPEVAAPKLRQKSYTEISSKSSNLVYTLFLGVADPSASVIYCAEGLYFSAFIIRLCRFLELYSVLGFGYAYSPMTVELVTCCSLQTAYIYTTT